MALESHEIEYWYPPLTEATRGHTSEIQNAGQKANRPTFNALRHVHAGAKRSRDEMSEEDDDSQAYPSPKRTPTPQTRSKAKVSLTRGQQTERPHFLDTSV